MIKMNNKTIISRELGCVYTLDENEDLLYAPLKAGSDEPAREFDYVDHMSLLGEEDYILQTIYNVEDKLRSMNGLLNL